MALDQVVLVRPVSADDRTSTKLTLPPVAAHTVTQKVAAIRVSLTPIIELVQIQSVIFAIGVTQKKAPFCL